MAVPKYNEWLTPENLTLIKGWARDGLNDEQIAHNMGITSRTLISWKKIEACKPIANALKQGREVVDYVVENALLKAATEGNVTAQIFWLKNRKPNQWRDRREPDSPIDTMLKAEDVLIKIKKASDELAENKTDDGVDIDGDTADGETG